MSIRMVVMSARKRKQEVGDEYNICIHGDSTKFKTNMTPTPL